jgi:Fe-S-cluster containining protein
VRYSDVARDACAAAKAALARTGRLADAAQAAIRVADDYLTRARTELNLAPQLDGLACKAGCGWCCHQIVGVTPAELALVTETVAALPDPDRERVRALAEQAATRGAGLDQRQWWAAHIRCPLLNDAGMCAIHTGRPLPCRAYNSADDQACRRSWEGEDVRAPVLAAQHGIYGHAQAGLSQALQEAGVNPGLYALALNLRF